MKLAFQTFRRSLRSTSSVAQIRAATSAQTSPRRRPQSQRAKRKTAKEPGVCTLSIHAGLIVLWPTANIMLFTSKNTPLNRHLLGSELSLLGSLSAFGGLLSTLVVGFLLDKLGRKKVSVLMSLSLTLVWAILSICKQVEVVLTCLFISGVSSCLPLLAGVYISEICQKSIRGSMMVCMAVCSNIGGLLAVTLGGSLQYDTLLYIGLFMAFSGTAALLLIKESPVYLLQIGKEKKAAKALAFYRQLQVDDKETTERLDTLKQALARESIGRYEKASLPEIQKLNPTPEPAGKLSVWQFMKKSQSSCQALFVNCVLMTASNIQGLVVIQIYIQPLIADTVPTYSPVTCSIVLAVVGVIAGAVAAYLTDVAGRRPLMIFGTLGSCVCCLILGTQMQFYWGPTWITLVILYTFSVMHTLGPSNVPMVLLSDLYLPEVKSILSTVVVEINCISKFIALCIFSPSTIIYLGWCTTFYIFAVMCFLTFVFTYFYLPETMGLTVEEVQPLFYNKKRIRTIVRANLML